jgi:hypothetical protein
MTPGRRERVGRQLEVGLVVKRGRDGVVEEAHVHAGVKGWRRRRVPFFLEVDLDYDSRRVVEWQPRRHFWSLDSRMLMVNEWPLE